MKHSSKSSEVTPSQIPITFILLEPDKLVLLFSVLLVVLSREFPCLMKLFYSLSNDPDFWK